MNRSREELTFKPDEVTCVICDTQMIWTDKLREWVCPKCGNRAYQSKDCGPDEIYFEHGPDDQYDEYYDSHLQEPKIKTSQSQQ